MTPYHIVLVFFGLISSVFTSTTLASQSTPSEELKKVLLEAKQDKKAFITRISKGLKQCTNGKMLELDHLTVKSSYWWDETPFKINAIVKDKEFPQINISKLLIIDRKERSSIYDRETPFVPWGQDIQTILKNFNLSNDSFVNDWNSAIAKRALFSKNDTSENKTPPELKGIVDYGFYYKKSLDTYPSIYQMLDVLKTLKYESKTFPPASPESTSCSVDSRNIRSQQPSQVIVDQLDSLFAKPYYQVFTGQNHPLNKIMQDHLKKLHAMASQGQINGNPLAHSKGYNPSIMYNKILQYVDYVIFLLSAFDMDMDKKICTIKESEGWSDIPVNQAYNLYVQFYEVINDLLFLLMSLENPYDTNQFDQILSKTYASRFPVLNELYHNNDIHMKSYPARSGMDAFAGSCLSLGYVPQDISIAPKVASLENTMYYEITSLIRQYPHRGQERSFLSIETDNNEVISVVRQAVLETYIDMFIKKSTKERGRSPKLSLDEYLEKVITLFNAQKFYGENDEDEDDDGRPVIVELGDEEDNDEFSLEKRVYQEILKNINVDTLMPATLLNGKSIIEVPMFITSRSGFYKAFLKKYNNILDEMEGDFDDDLYRYAIETHFNLDTHYSMSSGMTTDTVDLSDDPNYLNRLKTKIELIRGIKQQWQPTKDPFVMVWDTTMEIDQGPVYKLMEHYKSQIERGEVVFILFKSLQKYANLGIGKSKAGAITLIGKESPFVRSISERLSTYGETVFKRSQDYALMTFFYDRLNNPQFQDNEAFYFQSVRNHAQAIYQRSKNLGHMISGGCLFSRERTCNGLYADTFGFAVPTQTHIEGGLCRYSVGLDPKGLFGL